MLSNIVTTPFGAIEGTMVNGTMRFLGIPYAKAPVGALRFREPQPVDAWENTYMANQYRKDPMQIHKTLSIDCYSEDCLYLNIWVPPHADEPLPVMFWIPGGAYATGGSGAVAPEGPSLYECDTFAMNTGCIVVTVSYRLNVFGFLNFSSYSERFQDHLGMKDILFALQWLHDVIGSFGGDTENITIFGQSAGAGAVSAILCIDEAKTLFHKAILQSNCFESFYTPQEEAEITEKYLAFLDLEPNQVDEILELPVTQLMQASKKLDDYVLEHYFARCTFCPVVDGKFIKDFPTIAAFQDLKKPILVGSNKDEGNFLVAAYKWTTKEIADLQQRIFHRIAPEKGRQLLAAYPQLPQKKAFASLLTDVMYTMPKIWFAEHLSDYQDVYVYRYDYATPIMKIIGLGACHAAELLPLFNCRDKPYRTLCRGAEHTIRNIGIRMQHYWGNFARTGNPNQDGMVNWKPYNDQQRHTLILGKKDRLENDPDRTLRETYHDLSRLLI
ncbi:carboxylesterase/lipase family protein [Fusibacter paucivorans]|uniref:Carboxylic ester hydrolase n=1 Tax=Fusibacter paucivorans TaxID=76009 RepID=A0ABS5PJH6_9FIRM|nr:carboxylesterase/lipase family protein [Fusibacter paucivorans]MBS7525224.1 carboxylesterase/lipase family protein [Fusibacter paucivorans]